MNLADVLNGNIKIGKNTAITYNGQVYRGEKAIKELAQKEVGSNSEVTNGTDSEPAATKTRSRRRSSKPKTTADAKPADQPAGEPTDAVAGDGNTTTETTTS